MHLIPDSSLLDPIGPALRDLESATETLRGTPRARLAGDSTRIAGAALALTLLARELIAMHDTRAAPQRSASRPIERART